MALHTLSRPWSTAVAGIRRRLGGSLSSIVLQHRSYSAKGLDGRVPPNPSAVDPHSPAVPTARTFGAHREVYDRKAYPLRKCEGFRVYRPIVKLHRTALNEAERPVPNYVRAYGNVGQESCHDSPRRGFGSGKQLPSDPACGPGNIRLPSGSITSEAIAFLKDRRQQGLPIDSFMFVEILKHCSMQKDHVATRQVHDYIIQSGMQKHRHVATTLLSVYIKCGRFQDAHRVFDELGKINRNVITWNVMIGGFAKRGCGIEAFGLFQQMKREGFVPDAFTYACILNASASAGALEWVKQVHSDVRGAGLESDLRVGNALVHMYAKSGSFDDARLVFGRMRDRDVITWNIMIGAYAESGCGMEACRLLQQMKREGFIPNAITYSSILNASASAGALEWVKEVHSDVRRAGLESDLRVGNSLVHMYAKSGSLDDARLVFDGMEKRDVFTWNIMIAAYAESGSIDDARLVFDRTEKRDVITWTTIIGAYAKRGCGMEAYRLFLQMKREGFRPEAITYMSILDASARKGDLEWVTEVHSHARRAGLESDFRVGSALVHIYGKSGSIYDARLVFDGMKKRDVTAWNVMIGAYAESGCGVEAYGLFLQMKREGFKPDAITYVSILNAAASAGALKWVKEVHRDACRAGLESDLRVSNSLVHMYAKSGSFDDARRVFDRTETRDVVTWNTMIGGLALHGCGDEALKLFENMIEDGVKPDETSFVAVLSACCHAGLVDDGRRLFSAMRRDYCIEPTVVHYTCMVDLLGRAGHLEEAKLLIGDMRVAPNGVTWGALLGACRTYGNVELGELAAKELLKLDPKDASAYVLLSNIYSAAGKWEKASSVRNMMRTKGVRKEPGRSWIEVDNRIHEFSVGDSSHPEADAIYSELEKLTEQLKAKGYIPDTKLVLHDIGEDEKELALCSHSEKLAIAYGLLRVPPGKPIRVEKNLRVCSDCHAATKLISEVTGREIVVRDANRFHHFKDGVCSCGDYW